MRWIVGDIHGMLKPLVTLVTAVRAHDPKARFIFVGDYVNRGQQSRGVVEFLLELDDANFVRGNHDDVFDLVVNGQCYAENAAHGNRVAAFQWFMRYGLDATLLSYGVDIADLDVLAERCTPDHLDQIGAQVPAAHRDFIRNLPPVYEERDLFVVHGKWDPNEFAESPNLTTRLHKSFKLRHGLLWDRFGVEEIHSTKAWVRTGYFGHTPVSFYADLMPKPRPPRIEPAMLPVVGTKIVLVDTAAALGEDGRLTAYCADDQSFIQADHFGKLVTADD